MDFKSVLAALFGGKIEKIDVSPPDTDVPEPAAPGEGDELSPDGFRRYNSFELRDGKILVDELEQLGIPFEIELDDGIRDVDFRFGSAGQMARMTLYIRDADRDILDDLVKLHFHLPG
ncbi:MAG: hypothetical protein JJU00_09145 [Opitutales bacterium]|nr:hypothetical protein [Opitutales bacterium]